MTVASPSPPAVRPRLLIASMTYVVDENRKKLAALAAEGFELTCATLRSVESFGLTARVRDDATPAEYRLAALPSFGQVRGGTRFGLRGLGRLLRETRPDIVLVEAEPWSLLRWQLWSLHRWHCPQALFGEFTWENLTRPGWKGRVLTSVYRAAIRTGDFFIAGNRDAGDLLRGAGLHPNRLLVAPQMGVDEKVFAPGFSSAAAKERRAARQAIGLPPEAFLVGFCGRLEAMKGVPDLVATVGRLRADNPPRDVHLALLGAGPLRATLPAADWLHVPPARPHAEVSGFLQLLDLFILPSREWREGGTVWKEQFGHVLAEAMTCGVPCVGSSSGAIPEVIGDPDCIFPEGDVDALTGLLRRFLDDDGPVTLARLGAAQRARALAHYTNGAVAHVWGNFLKRRLAAETRSVLWVDPNLTLSSPSTKHLLYAAPHLLAANNDGWELRAWCFVHEPAPTLPAAVEVRRLHPLPLLHGPLWLWNFWLVANGHGLFMRALRGRPPARVAHTMGGLYLGADVASVHFVNVVWLRRQLQLGIRGWREAASWLVSVGGALMDWLQFRNRRCHFFLAVSDSIGAEVRARCHLGAVVDTLPNSYDETRFNPVTRTRWREAMRTELGFGTRDFVFVFVSQGHHRRKGFWLAVEALRRLRATGEQQLQARFLVVGGRPATVTALGSGLDQVAPDWRTWVRLTGAQPEVERYLAAADAFLFPSYFEAFCLAEIEAAALGLPLLLTPHHGSEMVLREDINGRYLDFDPAVMAGQIAGFMRTSNVATGRLPPGAMTRAVYAEALSNFYRRCMVRDAPRAGARGNPSPDIGCSDETSSQSVSGSSASGNSGSPDPCTTV